MDGSAEMPIQGHKTKAFARDRPGPGGARRSIGPDAALAPVCLDLPHVHQHQTFDAVAEQGGHTRVEESIRCETGVNQIKDLRAKRKHK